MSGLLLLLPLLWPGCQTKPSPLPAPAANPLPLPNPGPMPIPNAFPNPNPVSGPAALALPGNLKLRKNITSFLILLLKMYKKSFSSNYNYVFCISQLKGKISQGLCVRYSKYCRMAWYKILYFWC
jgi:hypothetical protein